MKIKSPPDYFEYFTQGDSPYFRIKRLNLFDMSWIDDLNFERRIGKRERIKRDIENGIDPGASYISDEDIASKDFDSIVFPLSHEWPKEFLSIYRDEIRESEDTIKGVIKTAKIVFKRDNLIIYAFCSDGLSYLSTCHFANGDVTVLKLCDGSNFDSIETAIHCFMNDYKSWELTDKELYDQVIFCSNLEALRQWRNSDDGVCEHSDLGSLGYKHGSVVTCPYCGKQAEVW